jgi:hypothetical protein
MKTCCKISDQDLEHTTQINRPRRNVQFTLPVKILAGFAVCVNAPEVTERTGSNGNATKESK